MADVDKLVSWVGVGVAADERGGEVGSAAVVAAAVGVEALQGELVAHPGGIFQGVGLQKGHNVVLDGDVLAAADRQVLEGVDARGKHAPDEGDAGDGGVAEVQAGQAGAVGGDDLLEEGVERVGLGLALSAVRRLVARRADGDGGLGQAEGQRLPCERVAAQEGAQVWRAVVELEEGGRGQLREERFEDGRVGGDDGFEQAEGAVLGCGGGGECGEGRRAGRAGLAVRAQRVEAHAGGLCVDEAESVSQSAPYESVVALESARGLAPETCSDTGEASAAPAGTRNASV